MFFSSCHKTCNLTKAIFLCSILFTTDAIRFHCFYIVYSTDDFISSFISLYSEKTLFTETNSSWLIHESIKDLEIRTSIILNIPFSDNTIWSCFFSLFLDRWLKRLNSWSDCTIFYTYGRTRNTNRNTN